MLLAMMDVKRLEVVQLVMDGKITIEQAAKVLDMGERQVWRLLASVREHGPEGVIHGNRGRSPWNARPNEEWKRIVRLFREKYNDANDTHFAELLDEFEGIVVSRQAVRRQLRAANLGPKRRRRTRQYRSKRERKPALGMMLQIDASKEHWLGQEREKLTLVGAKDDATGWGWYRFVRSETTWAYLELMREICLHAGVPLTLYSDRHDIFHSPKEQSIIEELNGERPLTQFGRAMNELGARIIPAGSAPAKGRIERQWETFQDRMRVELRLFGVTNIEQANQFLDSRLERYNVQFAVAPRDSTAVWRKSPRAKELDRILCKKYWRTVGMDHTVRIDGLILQIPRPKGGVSIANQHVEVLELRDGSIEIQLGQQTVARYCRSQVAKLIDQQSRKARDKPTVRRKRSPTKGEFTLAVFTEHGEASASP